LFIIFTVMSMSNTALSESLFLRLRSAIMRGIVNGKLFLTESNEIGSDRFTINYNSMLSRKQIVSLRKDIRLAIALRETFITK